jgi:hypothetical protein
MVGQGLDFGICGLQFLAVTMGRGRHGVRNDGVSAVSKEHVGCYRFWGPCKGGCKESDDAGMTWMRNDWGCVEGVTVGESLRSCSISTQSGCGGRVHAKQPDLHHAPNFGTTELPFYETGALHTKVCISRCMSDNLFEVFGFNPLY